MCQGLKNRVNFVIQSCMLPKAVARGRTCALAIAAVDVPATGSIRANCNDGQAKEPSSTLLSSESGIASGLVSCCIAGLHPLWLRRIPLISLLVVGSCLCLVEHS
jgi:hypothetical protein